MSILSTISDALCLYGKAINRSAVVSVTFEFKNTPTDLPSTPAWEATVRLIGSTSVDLENVENLFSQEFKGEADSEEEALNQAYSEIVRVIQAFLSSREEDTRFAQAAVMAVTTDEPLSLSSLWPTSEPEKAGHLEGA